MNILLDLDGTLTDPGLGFVKSIRYALDSLEVHSPSDDNISSYIGPPLEESLRKILGPQQEHNLIDAIRLYRERYSSVGLFENTVYEGVLESLDQIYSSGSPIFLATAKPTIFASRILAHFGMQRFFSGVYGSELDGTHSNKQHLLKFILQQENLIPEETIMVGDRSHDIKAALANGVSSLGVLWGYGTLEELTIAGAENLIHEPHELPSNTCSRSDARVDR